MIDPITSFLLGALTGGIIVFVTLLVYMVVLDTKRVI